MLVEEPVVLAIGAEPDSVTGLCAGTLALLRERGWRVALSTLTPGNCASDGLPTETAAELRRQETRRSAALLDAEYYCLDAADFTITYCDSLCRRVTALIRSVRPAVVLTHGPDDPTPDHEETSRIVRQACLAAPARHYDTRSVANAVEPTRRIPHLYYLDPLELADGLGRPVEPSLIVDVTSTMDTKTSMLAQHAGHAVWVRGQPGADPYLEVVRTWGQKRGQRGGFRFGEGFRQHLGPTYPRDDLLKKVLGPLGHELAPRPSSDP